MDNSKYYFVESKKDDTYPLVNILNLTEVKFGREDILEVVVGKPIPRNPVMADFLESAKDIFAKRITDVMQAMNMEGVRFFSTEVDDTKGTTYDNYVCVFAENNRYELLDKEKSEYTYKNRLYRIPKLVIDREKLFEISLNKRLCMHIAEAPGYTLYHQSVVDAVMALEPTGMYFQDIEDYKIL